MLGRASLLTRPLADEQEQAMPTRLNVAKNANPVRDVASITDLVTRARNGDKQAWDALVERYAALIWSICRRYRLNDADAADVGQTVWLRLVTQLDRVRDPGALPGWLVTTTQRECGQVLRATRASRGTQAAGYLLDAESIADAQAETAEHELLLAERGTALRAALTSLPLCCQRLITLLIEDPPVPYATISDKLGIPVGSIGPNRARCLEKLRRHPAIAALIAEGETAPSQPPGRDGN
jgi:RNA polymerase sigma factor (sigma-70 family)